MTRGLCESSIEGLVHFAICVGKHDINGASRIGKAAMSCLKKRYHTSEKFPMLNVLYYGTVAYHTEPLQSCADMLCRAAARSHSGICLHRVRIFIEYV
jgi:hypothetical protein